VRIKHHMTFQLSDKKIIKILNNYGIFPVDKNSIIGSFQIYEDDPLYKNLEIYIKNNQLLDFAANASYEYSVEDLSNSQWFIIRSNFFWNYPQPENQYKSITYSDNNYCLNCGNGLKQIGNFIMKSEPKWGKKSFLHLNWIYDELFINNKISQDLNDNNFNGLKLQNVLSNKGDILETVKQLYIENKIKCNYTKENIRKQTTCSFCNTEKKS